MAETIINSNQLRASGDTSTQTLINENQVRQSGDSSSQTLLNKNQIAGGGVEFKTIIYSQDNAYINTGIDNATIYGLRVKGTVRVNSYTGYQQQIVCGYYDISNSNKSDFSCALVSQIGGSVPDQYRKVFMTVKNNITSDRVDIAGISGTITTPNFDLKVVSSDDTKPKQSFDYKIFTGARDYQGGDFIAYTDGVVALEVVELYDISGNMIAELKPAIVNGESGMYDTVTETFYGNANSVGSLVCE